MDTGNGQDCVHAVGCYKSIYQGPDLHSDSGESHGESTSTNTSICNLLNALWPLQPAINPSLLNPLDMQFLSCQRHFRSSEGHCNACRLSLLAWCITPAEGQCRERGRKMFFYSAIRYEITVILMNETVKNNLHKETASITRYLLCGIVSTSLRRYIFQ